MRERRPAFTLVEILVALLVALFAIVPLLNMNTVARRRGQQGEAYALAQIEAERLIERFAGTLGYDELDGRLGTDSQTEFPENDPDVQAVLLSSTGLEQAARKVKRRVNVLRLEPGLLRVQALVEWQSTAPVQDLKLTLDRIVSNQRVSVGAHFPLVRVATPEECN